MRHASGAQTHPRPSRLTRDFVARIQLADRRGDVSGGLRARSTRAAQGGGVGGGYRLFGASDGLERHYQRLAIRVRRPQRQRQRLCSAQQRRHLLASLLRKLAAGRVSTPPLLVSPRHITPLLTPR